MPRTRIVVVVVALALSLAAFVTVFGNNVRQLFSTSVSTLAGPPPGPRLAANSRNLRDFARRFAMTDSGATPTDADFRDDGPAPTIATQTERHSTFGMDVDTASFTFARAVLERGRLPAPESVRVEEFINSFRYFYAAPHTGLSVTIDGAASHRDRDKAFIRVAIKAAELEPERRKPVHLTFLVDVSGSMERADRLGLAKSALELLVPELRPDDSVSLVTYAGAVEEVLQPTRASERSRILEAIRSLSSGGVTAMSDGLRLAYEHAERALAPGRMSRVLVLTDGDANVGATSSAEMLTAIQRQAKLGVTLSVLGFGTDRYNDRLLHELADRGNGHFIFVDRIEEARRVLVNELTSTLQLVARDAKVQVTFEPANVLSHRLVGYESRALATHEFREDSVDGGEVGAGHEVTALYEVRLAQEVSGELAKVRIRWLDPDTRRPSERDATLTTGELRPFEESPANLRLALAAMFFAEKLRGSVHALGTSFADVVRLSLDAAAASPDAAELTRTITAAKTLIGEPGPEQSEHPVEL